MPTLGAVGLSYWVASLPLSIGRSSVQWLAGPQGGTGSAAAADASGGQQPAPPQLAGPSTGVGAGELGAAPEGSQAAGRAGLQAAVSALLPASSTGDLLAAEGVTAAASSERQRQLQDLTVNASLVPLQTCRGRVPAGMVASDLTCCPHSGWHADSHS